jgi:hypothetical protein
LVSSSDFSDISDFETKLLLDVFDVSYLTSFDKIKIFGGCQLINIKLVIVFACHNPVHAVSYVDTSQCRFLKAK